MVELAQVSVWSIALWIASGFAGMAAGLALIPVVVKLLVGNHQLDPNDRDM